MPTVAEILSPIRSAAEVLAKAAHPLAKVPLQKSENEVSIDGGTAGHDFPDGSYENAINMVRTPAIRSLPCPGSEYGDSVDGQYHYPTIQGTYPDHVIAGCDACDRYWKVPYNVEDKEGRASVMVGTPEPRVRAYLAPNAAVDALNDPPFQPDEDDSTPEASQEVTAPEDGAIAAD